MKIKYSRILSVLLIFHLLIINGCGIGTGIGAIIDSRAPDTEIVNRENYNNIKILSEITIYQKDRSLKKGKLIDITEDYLTLEPNFGLENVDMEDIATIEAKSKKNALWIGLGIDLALYIAFIVSYGDGT